MVCSLCQGRGHNRRTCLRNVTGLNAVPPINNPPIRGTTFNLNVRNKWKKAIQSILFLKKFVTAATLLYYNEEDLKYCYYYWLKVKDIKGHLTSNVSNHWKYQVYIKSASSTGGIGGIINITSIGNYLVLTKNNCILYHLSVTDAREKKDKNRIINLINLKDKNYLVYWVKGNLMVEDIDSRENNINYMGMLSRKNSFKLRTLNGHRFYLIPHRLDIEPPYHPPTDKQFPIEPYLQINIHEGSTNEIYIDDREKLSELNRWKFNALKLDYLIKELIKLGAKNNDVLDSVLDLHEDIQLDQVSEWYKDTAGVPSKFTNIT